MHGPCSIIAAIGDRMEEDAAIPGRFLTALGQSDIPLVATAQGCSNRNFSVVVSAEDSVRALRAVHAAFLSTQVLSVGLVGVGFEGAELLDILRRQAPHLVAKHDIAVRVAGPRLRCVRRHQQ